MLQKSDVKGDVNTVHDAHQPDRWQHLEARYDRLLTVTTYVYLVGYIIPLAVTSFLAFQRDELGLGAMLGGFAVLSVGILVYVVLRGLNVWVRAILVTLVCCLFMSLALGGGYANTGLFWGFALIVVIYHFSTAVMGLVVNLSLIATTGVLLLLPSLADLHPDYGVATISRFLLTTAITSFLLFVYAMLQQTLTARLTEVQRQLLRTSMTDELTGLTNRRFMKKTLENEERRYAGRRMLAVAIADVDHFKRINDTLGHDAGDHVLRHIAQVLRDALRDSDRVARWGGEEFLVLLDVRAPDEATAVIEKLRATLEATPAEYEGQSIPMTASFGIKVVDSASAKLQKAVMAADENLLLAKNRGRNRVVAS